MERWEKYLDYLAMALKNVHMILDCEIILGGHMAPYLTESDLNNLFERIKEYSPFPEDDNFLRTGVQKQDAIAAGAALPFVRQFLESV
ncbi:MAG: ROK family protein [Clostridia bacterium]|nr:ROK family protein [Clostridia bacterium]